MYNDFKELLSAFNAHSVKYLIVGGYAVSFHAQPRVTKDLDLFIKADPTNAQATYAALASFGAPLDGVSVADLGHPRKFIRFGHPPVAVDILPSVDGVNFNEAWERRVEGVIDQTTGLTAFFISKSDLIASKIAAGRLRDLADVEEIREADDSQSKKDTE
jgi:predicted nucleotidyltransferase